MRQESDEREVVAAQHQSATAFGFDVVISAFAGHTVAVSAGSPNAQSDATLTIVGSRLQALSLLAIAGALVVAKRDELLPWVIPVVLVCVIWAATISARLAVLSPEGVSLRRINGTIEASHGHFEPFADHRYLKLTFEDGSKARIEVPVEIRPQVRDWAISMGGSSPQ